MIEMNTENLPLGDFSEYDMESIYPALQELKEGDVYLEVGVKYGKSLAFARKNTNPDVNIYGVDIANTNTFFAPKTHFIFKASNDALGDWNLPIDLLFIDADHSYEGCKRDWENFSPFVKVGGTVFFHDADDVGPGVIKVIEEIGTQGWEVPEVHKRPGFNTSMVSVRRLK